MGFYSLIKKNDKAIADRYKHSSLYFTLSPTRYSLTKVVFPMIEQHIRGDVLDAGAGRRAYETVLRAKANTYTAMDVQEADGLDALGSVLHLPWRDNAFDSIFCSQVLEHVPDPKKGMEECYRCLKPGGRLLLTVPHLAYLHNEPHDYFRYTHYGLRAWLSDCGFEVENILPAGGLLAFLGHMPSVIGKALLYPIPLVGRLAVYLNWLYVKFVYLLDRTIDPKKIYALNYVALAKKPQ